MYNRKLALFIASTVFVTLVATGCAPAPTLVPPTQPPAATKPLATVVPTAVPPAGPARGGTLTIAIAADPDGLDPHKTVAAATFQITRNIYDTLVQTDEKSNLLPDLATKWESTSDGLKWTFTLREGVKFHNGRAMTSDDVKFSFERLIAKETASPRAADYANIKSITAPDAKTVVFELNKPQANFLSNLVYGWAAIVPKESVATLRDKPVGTGPFKIVEWVKNSNVTLEKNSDYFIQGAPYLDKVVFKVAKDPTARLAALRAGEVDVIPEMPVQDLANIRKDPNFKTIEVPFNGIQLIPINNKAAPFDNVKVRQALNYAVDKKAVIDTAQFGIGVPIGTHLAPVSDYYVDLTTKYPYDPSKAKQLLADAGFPNGFSTTMILPQPYDYHIRNGQVVVDMLAKAGIKVTLQTMEWGTYLTQVYNGRQYTLTALGHTGRLDPDAFMNRYISTAPENYMNYNNPKYDQLAAQAAVEPDVKKRHDLYAQMETLLADDAAAIYLLAPTSTVVTQKSVMGWTVFPIDIYDMRTVWKSAGK